MILKWGQTSEKVNEAKKAKPVVRRGRKATGLCETAGLPRRSATRLFFGTALHAGPYDLFRSVNAKKRKTDKRGHIYVFQSGAALLSADRREYA